MLTDPIADFLTSIRNAQKAMHSEVSVYNSKIKSQIAEVLKKNNYIAEYKIDGRKINIIFNEKTNLTLKRISKPGQRIYVGAKKFPKIMNGMGICILSTSLGIMTDKEAKAKNIGGELLCTIY
jgi:small subunit ribosomal protein S8